VNHRPVHPAARSTSKVEKVASAAFEPARSDIPRQCIPRGQYLARGENGPQGFASAYASRNGVIWDVSSWSSRTLRSCYGCSPKTTNDITYRDNNLAFTDVTIEPKPVGGRMPFWYRGAGPAVRRVL
jgi:hypothetical protein